MLHLLSLVLSVTTLGNRHYYFHLQRLRLSEVKWLVQSHNSLVSGWGQMSTQARLWPKAPMQSHCFTIASSPQGWATWWPPLQSPWAKPIASYLESFLSGQRSQIWCHTSWISILWASLFRKQLSECGTCYFLIALALLAPLNVLFKAFYICYLICQVSNLGNVSKPAA